MSAGSPLRAISCPTCARLAAATTAPAAPPGRRRPRRVAAAQDLLSLTRRNQHPHHGGLDSAHPARCGRRALGSRVRPVKSHPSPSVRGFDTARGTRAADSHGRRESQRRRTGTIRAPGSVDEPLHDDADLLDGQRMWHGAHRGRRQPTVPPSSSPRQRAGGSHRLAGEAAIHRASRPAWDSCGSPSQHPGCGRTRRAVSTQPAARRSTWPCPAAWSAPREPPRLLGHDQPEPALRSCAEMHQMRTPSSTVTMC